MREKPKVVTKMDQKNKSWDHFFRNDSSNMLEDALPYLPSSLKKTAAIYIKLTELLKITSEFDNQQTLSACGLDQNNASIEMILNAMKLRAPKETAAQIDQLLQMMQLIKVYQTYQNFVNSNPNLASSLSSNQDSDILSKLMPMLMSGNTSTPNSSTQKSSNTDFMDQLNQILNK